MRSIVVSRPPSPPPSPPARSPPQRPSPTPRRSVSGASLKQGSLPGNRVKPNTLTGVQINESRLGVVPVAKLASFAELAKAADTAKQADHATNADTRQIRRDGQNGRDGENRGERDQRRGREEARRAGAVGLPLQRRSTPSSSPAGPISGADGSETLTARCPVGEQAIGGGGGWFQVGLNTTTELDAKVTASVPSPTDRRRDDRLDRLRPQQQRRQPRSCAPTPSARRDSPDPACCGLPRGVRRPPRARSRLAS